MRLSECGLVVCAGVVVFVSSVLAFAFITAQLSNDTDEVINSTLRDLSFEKQIVKDKISSENVINPAATTSDITSLQTTSDSQHSRRGCTLPDYPLHAVEYMLPYCYSSCYPLPGQAVQAGGVRVSCFSAHPRDGGYFLEATCDRSLGVWDQPFPRCDNDTNGVSLDYLSGKGYSPPNCTLPAYPPHVVEYRAQYSWTAGWFYPQPGDAVSNNQLVQIACFSARKGNNYLWIRCQRGLWDHSIPPCQIPPNCTLPDYPENVSAYNLLGCDSTHCHPRPGDSVPNAERVDVTCHEGFTSPSHYVQTSCDKGEWSENLPSCHRIPGCKLPDTTHGSYEFYGCHSHGCSTNFGDLPGNIVPPDTMINITCHPGYYMIPDFHYPGELEKTDMALTYCSIYFSFPECKENDISFNSPPRCTLPQYPPHVVKYALNDSKLKSWSVFPGQTVPYYTRVDVTCDDGYELPGGVSHTLTCTTGGWDSPFVPCEIEPGCILPAFDNNHYELAGVDCSGHPCRPLAGQRVARGSLVNVTCDPGHHMSVNHNNLTFWLIECRITGGWSDTKDDRIPQCFKQENSLKSSAGCTLPPQNTETEYKVLSHCEPSCRLPPGRDVPHGMAVDITCHDGYYLPAGRAARVPCKEGNWESPVSQCYKPCLPLSSTTMDLKCDGGDDEDPSCDRPQRFNATATFQCKEYYYLNTSDSQQVKCREDGSWSREVPSCELKCGLSGLDSSVLDAAKVPTQSQAGDFPWHAALYRKRWEGVWDNVCSGALVSTRHVLTARTCVTRKRCADCREELWSTADIIVALGKIRRGWQISEASEDRKEVEHIEIDEQHMNPRYPKTSVDAALLVLKSSAVINRFVIPVCLPPVDNIRNMIETSNAEFIYVTGWGLELSCNPGDKCEGDTSDVLLYEGRSFDFGPCFELMYTMFNRGRPVRRYCTESVMRSGDKGAAVVIRSTLSSLYYIVGVFNDHTRRSQRSFSTFTNMAYVRDWMDQLLRESTDLASCTLPAYPHNEYSIHSCSGPACSPYPTQNVTHGQLITVTCPPGYHMISGLTQAHSVCDQGNWTLPIPQCDNVCPPLTSATLDLKCWHWPHVVNCSLPQLVNTTVTFSCKTFYTPSVTGDPGYPRCGEDGQWTSDLPRCKPECGHSNLNSLTFTPTIVTGKAAEAGNFPWHAALFHNTSGEWQNVCGGSLVTTRHVLTAAHCVTQEGDSFTPDTMSPSDVKVALGKQHRYWSTQEPHQVIKAVISIVVGDNFRGTALNLARDIAVLRLDSEVEVNTFVMPVCLDLDNQHFSQITSRTNPGYVAGWGPTQDCRTGESCQASETLQYTRTVIHFFKECADLMQEKHPTQVPRLSTDKLCTEYGKDSVIQKGDSGGGLIFRFEKLHFIYGIISMKISNKDEHTIGTFTNVSEHLPWIRIQISF